MQSLRQQLKELDEKILQEREKLGVSDKPTSDAEILDIARKRFNTDCKKGISYLVETGYFANDAPTLAHDIAKFLFTQTNLSKANIGEYLGEHKPLNLQVLAEFVEMHAFHGLEFDAALRKYLWSFRLPGESQKIDRMMEAFAKRFCACNHNVFNSSDACYILAFSTIMLNTSLHNPSVQHKPTQEEFISMNRGIDNGNDIHPDLLRSLYESISREPFKIPDDAMGLSITFINPEHQGWLTKEGDCQRLMIYFLEEGEDGEEGERERECVCVFVFVCNVLFCVRHHSYPQIYSFTIYVHYSRAGIALAHFRVY